VGCRKDTLSKEFESPFYLRLSFERTEFSLLYTLCNRLLPIKVVVCNQITKSNFNRKINQSLIEKSMQHLTLQNIDSVQFPGFHKVTIQTNYVAPFASLLCFVPQPYQNVQVWLYTYLLTSIATQEVVTSLQVQGCLPALIFMGI
jgi:hypothetical protein